MTAHPRPCPTRTPLSQRAWWALLTTLLLAAVLTALPASSARAHDDLASSTPGDGEVVRGELSAVSLTFTEAPLAELTGASRVVVTAPGGETASADAATADGASVSVPVTFAGPGTYQVVWQTVSSDGHPISGDFSFQWEDAAPSPSPSPTATAPGTAAPQATEAPAAGQPQESAADPAGTEQPDETPLWIPVTVGLVVLLVLGAAVYFVSRPRRGNDTTSPRA